MGIYIPANSRIADPGDQYFTKANVSQNHHLDNRPHLMIFASAPLTITHRTIPTTRSQRLGRMFTEKVLQELRGACAPPGGTCARTLRVLEILESPEACPEASRSLCNIHRICGIRLWTV